MRFLALFGLGIRLSVRPLLAQSMLETLPPEVQKYGPYAAGGVLALLLLVLFVRRKKGGPDPGLQAALDRAKILLGNGRPDAASKEIELLLERGVELDIPLKLLYVRALFETSREADGDSVVVGLPASDLSLKQRYDLARILEKGDRKPAAESYYRSILLEDGDYADVKIRLDRLNGSSGNAAGGVLGFGFDPSSIARHLSNRYMKMELIGKGGMGFVFRAFDQKRKRTVAIKALSPFLTEEKEAVQRFMREARLLSKFEHPNVVKIFDVEEQPIVFYSMEFLKGRTLGHRLEEEGPLTVKELISMAEALLLGLVHIHGHGVVHRDIKPENVLLDVDGTPRFTDFGLAVGDQASRITQQGQVMGTLRYMAPEQMRGEEVGVQGDLFSLGVTLYEAASGIHAFSGEDRINRRLSGSLAEVSQREIPQGMVSLIELMMENREEDRVQSAEEALEMVRSLKRQLGQRGPVAFIDATMSLRQRVVAPLAGFFSALSKEGEPARREFFEESSNVRDLKLLVWRLNEGIGRIQGAGSPPKGSDPRTWAPETGQLRNDLARFVRHLDMGAIDAFSLRIRRLDKQLQDFLKPFHLKLITSVLQPLEKSWSGKIMMRLPEKEVTVYGVSDVKMVRAEIHKVLHGLLQAGRPSLQEVAFRYKLTPEGDRALLQITGDGIEKGHSEAERALQAFQAEIGFEEIGAFKAWFPLVLADENARRRLAEKAKAKAAS